MRITVCEDNKETCIHLGSLIQQLMADAEISICCSGEELVRLEPAPDIVLLDVELGSGMNGVDAARALRTAGSDCAIIFVSGKEKYVFNAFDVDAVHYLLKPVDKGRLSEVLNKAASQLARARGTQWDRQMVVMSSGRRVRVHFDSIQYAEVLNRTIILHTTNGDISYYGKLRTLAEQCGQTFCRTHRAYLVNLHFVESYSASHVDVAGERVPVSKKQYPLFVAQFTEYVRATMKS